MPRLCSELRVRFKIGKSGPKKLRAGLEEYLTTLAKRQANKSFTSCLDSATWKVEGKDLCVRVDLGGRKNVSRVVPSFLIAALPLHGEMHFALIK